MKIQKPILFVVILICNIINALGQTAEDVVKSIRQKYASIEIMEFNGNQEKNISGRPYKEGVFEIKMDKDTNFTYHYQAEDIKYYYSKKSGEINGEFIRDFTKDDNIITDIKSRDFFTEKISLEEGLSALTGGTSGAGIDIPLIFYGYYQYQDFGFADTILLHNSENYNNVECYVMETIKISTATEEKRKADKAHRDSIVLSILGFIPDPNALPPKTTVMRIKWWIDKKEFLIRKKEDNFFSDGEKTSTTFEYYNYVKITSR